MVCQSKFTAVLVACLVAGCAPLPTRLDSSDGVRVDRGALLSRTGCVLDYSRYRRPGTPEAVIVILGHGFLRTQRQMSGLARALAASGLSTVTMDFCRTGPWRTSHVRNGFDMIRVADGLHARRVVYVGFSAGGLAALIAARNDARALGAVTLDLVDAEGIGRRAAAGLERPLIGLVGDPSACNARSNGLAVLAASRQARSEHIPGATHCDFESPTDQLCQLLCGSARPSRDASGRIVRAALAAIRSLVGDEPSDRARFSPPPRPLGYRQ